MSFWKRFLKHKMAVIGGCFVLLFLILAIFPAQIAPYDPYQINPRLRGAGPSLKHPFGCDQIGRDILSRIIYGARVDLKVGFLATALALLFGASMGIVAGYYGSILDTVIMRFVDTLMAFPIILLTMLIVSLFGSSINYLIVGMAIPLSSRFARVIRSDTLSIRNEDYISAASAIGCGDIRILIRHVLINAFPPIIVLVTFNVAQAMLLEVSLGFLGLGVQPPHPSWGRILGSGRDYLRAYPHISIFPGIAISLTVFGLNFIGEGLRDALDPRLKTGLNK